VRGTKETNLSLHHAHSQLLTLSVSHNLVPGPGRHVQSKILNIHVLLIHESETYNTIMSLHVLMKQKMILFSYLPPIELANIVTSLYRCAGSLECFIVFEID
jgi:hypothetical protein